MQECIISDMMEQDIRREVDEVCLLPWNEKFCGRNYSFPFGFPHGPNFGFSLFFAFRSIRQLSNVPTHFSLDPSQDDMQERTGTDKPIPSSELLLWHFGLNDASMHGKWLWLLLLVQQKKRGKNWGKFYHHFSTSLRANNDGINEIIRIDFALPLWLHHTLFDRMQISSREIEYKQVKHVDRRGKKMQLISGYFGDEWKPLHNVKNCKLTWSPTEVGCQTFLTRSPSDPFSCSLVAFRNLLSFFLFFGQWKGIMRTSEIARNR